VTLTRVIPADIISTVLEYAYERSPLVDPPDPAKLWPAHDLFMAIDTAELRLLLESGTYNGLADQLHEANASHALLRGWAATPACACRALLRAVDPFCAQSRRGAGATISRALGDALRAVAPLRDLDALDLAYEKFCAAAHVRTPVGGWISKRMSGNGNWSETAWRPSVLAEARVPDLPLAALSPVHAIALIYGHFGQQSPLTVQDLALTFADMPIAGETGRLVTIALAIALAAYTRRTSASNDKAAALDCLPDAQPWLAVDAARPLLARAGGIEARRSVRADVISAVAAFTFGHAHFIVPQLLVCDSACVHELPRLV
jgi:hypothetical protein